MKALILAAGYATRLRPLTDMRAKELLPVGGRPIIDWILDGIHEVHEIDSVHVVTNARKAPWFETWLEGHNVAQNDVAQNNVVLHDDGTKSNDDRLGAIGDLAHVLKRVGGHDDWLVIAGDNLFEFSLAEFVSYWRGEGVASAVAVRDVGSRELASRYGIVALAPDHKIVDFVEKPADPPSTLAATATYIFHRSHLALVATYLAEGNSPDQPGRFVGWLQAREPVYAWTFEDAWYDIGDEAQLLEADNHLRARHGLPLRTAYEPDS
ncbi:MAG TPA: nucleotidyltransferase family protein [Gaiellaceae bacterium]